jgi:hypothetical protein
MLIEMPAESRCELQQAGADLLERFTDWIRTALALRGDNGRNGLELQ